MPMTPADVVMVMGGRPSAPKELLRLYEYTQLEDKSTSDSHRRKMQVLSHIIDMSSVMPIGEVIHTLDTQFAAELMFYKNNLAEKICEGIDYTREKVLLLRCIIKYKDSMKLLQCGDWLSEDEYNEYEDMVREFINSVEFTRHGVTNVEGDVPTDI